MIIHCGRINCGLCCGCFWLNNILLTGYYLLLWWGWRLWRSRHRWWGWGGWRWGGWRWGRGRGWLNRLANVFFGWSGVTRRWLGWWWDSNSVSCRSFRCIVFDRSKRMDHPILLSGWIIGSLASWHTSIPTQNIIFITLYTVPLSITFLA